MPYSDEYMKQFIIRGMAVRPSVRFASDYFKDINPVCMEIGVQAGEHAMTIYATMNPKKLYLVDPWVPINRTNIGEDYTNSEIYYQRTKEKYEGNEKVVIIKGYSQIELPKLPFNSFDFIYIDGAHYVEEVISDIMNSLDLIKIGGIIAGHDYGRSSQIVMVQTSKKAGGVACAVDFVFDGMFVNGDGRDWWVIVDDSYKECRRK